jgi:hypothetical protein
MCPYSLNFLSDKQEFIEMGNGGRYGKGNLLYHNFRFCRSLDWKEQLVLVGEV